MWEQEYKVTQQTKDMEKYIFYARRVEVLASGVCNLVEEGLSSEETDEDCVDHNRGNHDLFYLFAICSSNLCE